MIRYFSMFSGIGGFEHGMEKSKHEFECVGYSEIDKYARSIYERHYPNHINWGDATEIRTEELPDFDLLVGGFPCQAFSNAGKKGGFDDTRGTLFFEIARVLKDKRPKYFLLENVKGLLFHDKGETFKTMLRILSNMGYYVKWEVYNSSYFGVPQKRERIFIKGYFGEKCGREVLSFRKRDENDYGGLNKASSGKSIKLRETTKKGYREARVGDGVELSRIACTVRRGVCHENSTGALNTKKGNWGTVTNDFHIRRLTPKECERLQGFPDNWTEFGSDGEKISDTQRYKCLGNAVTTNVITVIMDEMFDEKS